MCLPHCPTYQITQSETESPRGRLSLISAFFNGQLEMDSVLQNHLDHCLLCRSCESVCPAAVPFANIMDGTRAILSESVRRKTLLKRLLLQFVSRKKRARILVNNMIRFRFRGLIKWIPLKAGSGISRYMNFARDIQPSLEWEGYYPALGKQKHSVGLFLGCVQEFFDRESLNLTIRVLNALGVGVYVPAEQQCCGAMHLHAGEAGIATSLYSKNKRAFEQHDIDTVISLSSACSVTLMEQSQSKKSALKSTPNPLLNVMDVVTYLEKIEWYKHKTLLMDNRHVFLHSPCTQRNVLKNTGSIYKMLSRIPGLTIQQQQGKSCCGAAGSYTLDYPEWSDQLKRKAAEEIDANTDAIVSTNIGCILQFRQLSNEKGEIQVLHPINILARSLGCLQ